MYYECAKKLLAVFALVFTPMPCCAAQPCQDSATEAEIVKLLKQDNAALTLTPASFIKLQPEIRKALGQNITVCPQIPLNARGKPYTRLKLDFPEIWDAFEIAVNNGDLEQAQFIVDCVQANPLPPEALVSLLTFPLWSRDNREKAAQILGTGNSKDEWGFFVLDAFRAMGGKATKAADIVWANNAMDLEQAATRAGAQKKEAIFMPYSGAGQNDVAASLQRLGVNFINARNFLK